MNIEIISIYKPQKVFNSHFYSKIWHLKFCISIFSKLIKKAILALIKIRTFKLSPWYIHTYLLYKHKCFNTSKIMGVISMLDEF